MPKGSDYSSKTFKSLNEAYRRYETDRLRETTNPTLAPRGKFASVWGWAKKKRTAGTRARQALVE